MISGGRREDEESARATHLWFCFWAMCAFSIMSSAHWHSPVRPVTAQAQTVGVGIRHTCYLHPSAGRERAASARSSRGTLGHAPLSKGQGPVDSQQLDSLRGSCAKPRSRSSAAPAEIQAAFRVERGASQVIRSYGAGSYGHTVLDPTVIHVPPWSWTPSALCRLHVHATTR